MRCAGALSRTHPTRRTTPNAWRTWDRRIRSKAEPQSSALILMSLWTDFTCSVPRAMDTALSAACWDLALPLNHTTPLLSVST